MARPIRIRYQGAVYHVMNRGQSRRKVFLSDQHYRYFLDLLKEAVTQWQVKIHSVSLMPNHYHLLIETPQANVSRTMQHINGVYTQWFNRRTDSDGPLFRGRYKSILVEEDAYLVELLRYIHLNPVKAHLAQSPADHPWSSHGAYLKNIQAWDWLTTDRLLSYFGTRRHRARSKMHEFVCQGVPKSLQAKLAGNKWPSVLSSVNFREWVEWNFVKGIRDRAIQYQAEPTDHAVITRQRLKQLLSRTLEAPWQRIKEPVGRKQREQRAIAITVMRQELGMSYERLSKEFGGINPASISRAIKRAPQIDPPLWEYLQAAIQNAKRKL